MDADNRKPQFEDIDRWLDSALRERANAEPRGGLEERVLTRLAAEPAKRMAWWPVTAAVAAVVVIAIALVVIFPRRQERIVGNGQQSPMASPETRVQANPRTPDKVSKPTQARVPTRMLAHRTPQGSDQSSAGRVEPEPLPKLATFPAPRPETAEERMLARLAARRGSLDVASVSTDQLPLKDLSVPEFKIHPMEEPPSEDTPQE